MGKFANNPDPEMEARLAAMVPATVALTDDEQMQKLADTRRPIPKEGTHGDFAAVEEARRHLHAHAQKGHHIDHYTNGMIWLGITERLLVVIDYLRGPDLKRPYMVTEEELEQLCPSCHDVVTG